MHILRIDLDTGQRLDFGFRDKEDGARILLVALGKGGGWLNIADDHGHEGAVHIEHIVSIMLVDVAAESAGVAEVRGVAAVAPLQSITPDHRVLAEVEGRLEASFGGGRRPFNPGAPGEQATAGAPWAVPVDRGAGFAS